MEHKSLTDRINSGEIKITSKAASIEEVKSMSKRRSSLKELVRRAKVGTGEIPRFGSL